LVQQFHQQRFL